MKRKTVLISVVAIMFIAGTVFTGCKDKDKSKEKAKQEQEQKAFENNIESYPADFKDFVSEVVKSGMVPQDGKVEIGLAKLQGKITYKKEGNEYSGKLSEPVYVKVKNRDQVCMRNGAQVVDYEKKSVIADFSVEPFKYEWEKEELKPVARKYELSITSSDIPNHTGPAYETYEEFVDVSKIGNPKFQILDLKKEVVENDDERLAYLVWKDGEPFAFRKDGKEWGRR